MGFDPHQQWERTILQLHDHALQRLLGLLDGNFQQTQNHGLVFAQHFARGDAKQNGVSNLTSCAGNGNANGFFAHGKNSRKCCKNGYCPEPRRKARVPQNGAEFTLEFSGTVNLSYVLYKI